MKKSLIAASLFWLALSPLAHAEESSALAVSAGAFDFNKHDNPSAEVGVEYRFAPMQNAFDLIPVIGLTGNTDGGYWVHGGLRYDFHMSDRWVLTPNFAAVLYEQGGSKDLGHVIEFRSGLDLGYQLDKTSRVSLGIYHMSNASLSDHNPGEESLIVTYSFTPNF